MNTARISCLPTFCLLATTGAALALHDDAVASDSTAPLQRVVSYADLNLDDSAGVKRLYDRLTHAAKAVCQPMASSPYVMRTKARRCAAAALRDAVATVDNDNLTAYHNERTVGSSEAGRLAARR